MKFQKSRFLFIFCVILCLGGCSSNDGVRRIRVTSDSPERSQKTSVRRIGTYVPSARTIGPVGGTIVGVAGYSVVQGVATFGQVLGQSMIGAGGLKPVVGAVLYVPASALQAVARH